VHAFKQCHQNTTSVNLSVANSGLQTTAGAAVWGMLLICFRHL
jgi:hypothetical protein